MILSITAKGSGTPYITAQYELLVESVCCNWYLVREGVSVAGGDGWYVVLPFVDCPQYTEEEG